MGKNNSLVFGIFICFIIVLSIIFHSMGKEIDNLKEQLENPQIEVCVEWEEEKGTPSTLIIDKKNVEEHKKLGTFDRFPCVYNSIEENYMCDVTSSENVCVKKINITKDNINILECKEKWIEIFTNCESNYDSPDCYFKEEEFCKQYEAEINA